MKHTRMYAGKVWYLITNTQAPKAATIEGYRYAKSAGNVSCALDGSSRELTGEDTPTVVGGEASDGCLSGDALTDWTRGQVIGR